MFNFNQILSLTFDHDTGKTIASYHDIVAARLCGEVTDRTPDGANMYEIDLEPVDDELDEPISGLTIVVGNSGDWVQVQRGLDPKAGHETKPGTVAIDMVDALISDRLLIVTDVKENATE